MFEVGDSYKKFVVADVFDVPDFHSKAVHLVHRRTGLEVVHFLNDDSENLFSFSFRTPNRKANGAAHILEHSVLCGSEKFPLKDPFVALSNQSVKTYLNAMTFPDRTVFPASSIMKADYFNLLNVYGDAVFFPRLDREIFMQEAHRLEVDSGGNPSIQGVVYNEMKGDYSSFDSIVSNVCNESVFGGSVYAKDSGGDPLEIPSITYEEFKEFHKKWYRPDNCLVFFYGNIPTEEQLDFLQANFLDRLERKFTEIDYSGLSMQEMRNVKKARVSDFLAFVSSPSLSSPAKIFAEGPGGDESGNSVVVNWVLGTCDTADVQSEKAVMCGILLNHGGSPLYKALVDSGLGEDLSPQVGFSSYLYNSVFSVGLRGVKKGDEKKVEKVIFDTLEKIVKDGISEKDIESTLMSMEFAQREIKRLSGPYSKTLMAKIVYGWLYGFDMSRQIRQRDTLDKIKSKIKNDPRFFENKMKSLLLDNLNRSLVVVTPSENYTKSRAESEKAIARELLSKTSVEKVRSDLDRLHEFQKSVDDVSCIPHLDPKDFIVDGKPMMNVVSTSVEWIDGVDSLETGRKIPLFTNEENTNGIVYMSVAFPVDSLDADDYPYVPALTDALDDSGWVRRSDGKFLDWAESSAVCALHTGGLTCSTLCSDNFGTAASMEKFRDCNWVGRKWVVYKVAMLEEETETSLEILADCMTGADFRDEKRLSDIFVEDKNDFESSIVPDGHLYVDSRAKLGFSTSFSVNELWSGVSQLYVLKRIVDCDKTELAERFRRMSARLRDGGAFIHVTAESGELARVKSLLPSFVSNVGLKSLSDCAKVDEERLFALASLPERFGEENSSDSGDCRDCDVDEEILVLNSQVGFAGECFESSPYGTEDEAVEDVCSHWLSNNLLWERIRTIGGAYGAFCMTNPTPGVMSFSTYRDPKPFSSCDVFEKCLKEAAGMEFGMDDVEKAIVGDYSQWLQPQSPRGRGVTGLLRTLSGTCDSDRERKLRWLLAATPEKVRGAFKTLEEKAVGSGKKRKVIMCSREEADRIERKRNRKIIYLPI
nr:insulinase family protein [Treponema sp.]